MIKPTKIAGSFVLFGGGSVEAANVTLYSAFSAMPKTYDERKALPGMFTMFHTPVLLGRSRGIFCGVIDFPAPDNWLTAAVFFEGTGFKTDVTLNRLKVDKAKTPELDEKTRAKSSFEEWVKRYARCGVACAARALLMRCASLSHRKIASQTEARERKKPAALVPVGEENGGAAGARGRQAERGARGGADGARGRSRGRGGRGRGGRGAGKSGVSGAKGAADGSLVPTKYSDIGRGNVATLRAMAAHAEIDVPASKDNLPCLKRLLCAHFDLHAGAPPLLGKRAAVGEPAHDEKKKPPVTLPLAIGAG